METKHELTDASIKETNTPLDAAQAYASRGWRVIPVYGFADGCCTCGSPNCSSPGKHPSILAWPKKATCDPDLIHTWFNTWPNENVGLATGKAGSFFVLDVDPKHGGDDSIANLEERHGELPPTIQAHTGGGGRHIFFAYPKDVEVRNSAGRLGDGLDIRGEGGFIVAPPSTHASGGQYQWDEQHHPDDMEMAEAPQWLLDLLFDKPADPTPPVSPSNNEADHLPAGPDSMAWHLFGRELAALAVAKQGTRNNTLNRASFLAGRLVAGGAITEQEAHTRIAAMEATLGLGHEEFERTFNSGFTGGRKSPWSPDSSWLIGCLYRNEVGDAQVYRLVSRGRACYDHAAKKWYLWGGHHWREDVLNDAVKQVDLVVDLYNREHRRQRARAEHLKSVDEGDESGRASRVADALKKRIDLLNTSSKRNNILKLARSGKGTLGITGEEWDTQPLMVGLEGGVLEFKPSENTVCYRPGAPEDYIKSVVPTPWPAGATFQTYTLEDLERLPEPTAFLKFLAEIFGEDQELIGFIQRLFGYALTGLANEDVLVILWGAGRNGKTTLLETLGHVLGPLAEPVPVSLLLHNRQASASSGPRPDIMALRGKRLVWASEPGKKKWLDAATVKLLSGGDTISARALHQNQVTFQPTHTLLLLTNHKPPADPTDRALWERLAMVPFEFAFVPEPKGDKQLQCDPNLQEKLLAERPAILGWLTKGTLEYFAQGLQKPEVVLASTSGYRLEVDQVGQFIDACCALDPLKRVTGGHLRQAYEAWCEDEGQEPVTKQFFGQTMADRFEKRRIQGTHNYLGLKLNRDGLAFISMSEGLRS